MPKHQLVWSAGSYHTWDMLPRTSCQNTAYRPLSSTTLSTHQLQISYCSGFHTLIEVTQHPYEAETPISLLTKMLPHMGHALLGPHLDALNVAGPALPNSDTNLRSPFVVTAIS